MGEDHAICAHVLRYALAIVGIFRCGPGTYSYSQLERGHLSGLTDILRFQIIFFFLRDTVSTIVSYNFDLRGKRSNSPSVDLSSSNVLEGCEAVDATGGRG